MARQNLNELIRDGPPISFVADMLGISRPTFYRYMEAYQNSEDSKINRYVKEYFDAVIMGKFKTKDDARNYLEQTKYLVEGQKEEKTRIVLDERRKLEQEYRNLQFNRSEMTPAQRVAKEEEFDKHKAELEEYASSNGVDLEDGWFMRDQETLEWNQGEIRSTCKNFIESVYVIVDVPYEKLKDVSVELLTVISGEDFSLKTVKMPLDCRCVNMGDVPDGLVCKYRIKWVDGDKVKTIGPYDIGMTGY